MLVSMKEMMDPPWSSFMLLCWEMMNWSMACMMMTSFFEEVLLLSLPLSRLEELSLGVVVAF